MIVFQNVRTVAYLLKTLTGWDYFYNACHPPINTFS